MFIVIVRMNIGERRYIRRSNRGECDKQRQNRNDDATPAVGSDHHRPHFEGTGEVKTGGADEPGTWLIVESTSHSIALPSALLIWI